jgi:three-Cys-motif partner protein
LLGYSVSLAGTEALDLWLLFPSGIGVNRLLQKSGRIPLTWERALDRMFGDRNWREAFYSPAQNDLFGDEFYVKEANVETIEREYMDRLRTVFARVMNRAVRLRNKTNSVMYSLIFCCSNPRPSAYSLALKFAEHAVRKWND